MPRRKSTDDEGWRTILEVRRMSDVVQIRVRGGEIIEIPEGKNLTFTYRVRDGVLIELPKGNA
jgi:hypothetical protein